ncbi:MAG: pyruvate kinase [Thermogutta sp.]
MTIRPSQTKIVATLGPASDSYDRICALIRAGVDVFRLNTAHGTLQDHEERLHRIRRAEREIGWPIGVLVDLAGPKIRLGELYGGSLECTVGMTVRFIRGDKGTSLTELPSTYPMLVDELSIGDRVMLADGTVSLRVTEKGKDFAECKVGQPGTIRSRQGINLPGVQLKVAAITESDREAVTWAIQREIDFLGLSFVRSPDDVAELRSLIAKAAVPPAIIAKIEKPEALQRLEDIVAESDGVMVARGDLGVEVDIAEVPVIQKRIVQLANRVRKPVIVATQMLDSMQNSRLPTRAEVTDVANAILDGADACMLSGETAIGKYPVESVQMMHQIAMATEATMGPPRIDNSAVQMRQDNPVTEASVRHAGAMAAELGARMLITVSRSGSTALVISKYRFPVLSIGISQSLLALRRMTLYWGIVPLQGVPTGDPKELLEFVIGWARRQDLVQAGDRVVFLFGTGTASSAHNTIAVHVVD